MQPQFLGTRAKDLQAVGWPFSHSTGRVTKPHHIRSHPRSSVPCHPASHQFCSVSLWLSWSCLLLTRSASWVWQKLVHSSDPIQMTSPGIGSHHYVFCLQRIECSLLCAFTAIGLYVYSSTFPIALIDISVALTQLWIILEEKPYSIRILLTLSIYTHWV